jgi:hypothetical protein
MSDIFLNYRRNDSGGWALRFADRLRKEFGKGSVFVDVDDIRSAEIFPNTIGKRLARARMLVSVVGPGWLSAQDDSGAVRLESSEDYVRLEVEAALEREKPLLVALVNGATMPKATELPESLQKMTLGNSIVLRDATWDMDCGLAVGEIARIIGEPLWKRLLRRFAAPLLLILGAFGLYVVARFNHTYGSGWGLEVWVVLFLASLTTAGAFALMIKHDRSILLVLATGGLTGLAFLPLDTPVLFYTYTAGCIGCATAIHVRRRDESGKP